jgi:RHS repeat-associated protein
VEGSTENKYATADRPSYNATYSQSFAFSDDGLCNMTGKTSKESEVLEDDLNYTLDYTYDSDYAHRAVQAGKRYYKYDANGNLIREQDRSFADTDSSDEVTYHLIKTEAENVYSSDYAWARMKGGSTAYAGTKSNYYYRDYTWNERNLLSKTKDDSYTTEYLYGGDGQRAVKRSSVSETLYFNKFFTQRYDDAYQGAGGRMSKHIFLGNDRIVTKQVALGTGETYDNADTAVEKQYTYYYHADHLGSTSVVTDHNGEVYERLEYTPYGETWLDETNGDTYFDTPYRFSAKEKDEETGLYYYGARYLDPKYSRWISADPALGEYLPQAPVNDEAKKHNQSLPGQGGVFNIINLNLYHYAGNNPITYTDPDGKKQNLVQKLFTKVISFGVSHNENVAFFVKNHTNVAVTRDVYEGETFKGDDRTFYQDNLSVEVCGIPLNDVQCQSTPDNPNKGDTIANGTKSKADVGASGATKPYIHDTLLFDDLGDFFHIKKPGTIKPGSQGCTIPKNDGDVKETMDILREDLGVPNGKDKVNYSFDESSEYRQNHREENQE